VYLWNVSRQRIAFEHLPLQPAASCFAPADAQIQRYTDTQKNTQIQIHQLVGKQLGSHSDSDSDSDSASHANAKTKQNGIIIDRWSWSSSAFCLCAFLEVICSTMYYSPRYDMITNCLIHLGDDCVSGLFDDASDFWGWEVKGLFGLPLLDDKEKSLTI